MERRGENHTRHSAPDRSFEETTKMRQKGLPQHDCYESQHHETFRSLCRTQTSFDFIEERTIIPKTTPSSQKERWVSDFAELEAGEETNVEDYINMALDHQSHANRPTCWTTDEIPEPWWIEEAIRKLKNNKATGLDLLPAELLKSSPSRAASVLLPILWKMTLRMEEPLQYKGGLLRDLWKQRGSQQECENSRSILLMDNCGKVLRAATRRLTNRAYQENSQEMQMAGKKHQTVLFGSQTVRSFDQYCKARNHSTILVFANVQAAFYQTIRQLSVGEYSSDFDMARLVQRLQLPPETMHELYEAAQKASAHEHLGGSSLETTLLCQSLQDSWFTYSKKQLIATFKGTRPGDSWADICFNILANKLLETITMDLQKAGLVTEFPEPATMSPISPQETDQKVPLAHVTWADDITLLLAASKPELIPDKLATATYIMNSTMERYGMKLSLGPQKAAAVITPRGAKAVQMKRKLFAQKDATIPVLCDRAVLPIPLVSQYKHLGGIIAAGKGLLPELRQRAAKAWSAFQKASKSVFRNRTLDAKLRLRIFEATVMSIWHWGCGAWPTLSKAEEKYYVHTTVLRGSCTENCGYRQRMTQRRQSPT